MKSVYFARRNTFKASLQRGVLKMVHQYSSENEALPGSGGLYFPMECRNWALHLITMVVTTLMSGFQANVGIMENYSDSAIYRKYVSKIS
ncbi:hypothetical protein NM75_19140 [Dickeya fangzhongdai]|nr:hypothetical protein LH89_04485 [Dickeya fangzhongdai]KGT96643.1 hypothetical protein NM75_19140 [Dickeya fangzhongdai]